MWAAELVKCILQEDRKGGRGRGDMSNASPNSAVYIGAAATERGGKITFVGFLMPVIFIW
jgi:hypothetical protein